MGVTVKVVAYEVFYRGQTRRIATSPLFSARHTVQCGWSMTERRDKRVLIRF